MKKIKSITIGEPTAINQNWVFIPINLQFGLIRHNDYGRAAIVFKHRSILFVDANLPENLNEELDNIVLKELLNTPYDFTGFETEDRDLCFVSNWIEIKYSANWDNFI